MNILYEYTTLFKYNKPMNNSDEIDDIVKNQNYTQININDICTQMNNMTISELDEIVECNKKIKKKKVLSFSDEPATKPKTKKRKSKKRKSKPSNIISNKQKTSEDTSKTRNYKVSVTNDKVTISSILNCDDESDDEEDTYTKNKNYAMEYLNKNKWRCVEKTESKFFELWKRKYKETRAEARVHHMLPNGGIAHGTVKINWIKTIEYHNKNPRESMRYFTSRHTTNPLGADQIFYHKTLSFIKKK